MNARIVLAVGKTTVTMIKSRKMHITSETSSLTSSESSYRNKYTYLPNLIALIYYQLLNEDSD